MVSLSDVDALRLAFGVNPNDIGIGLYNPLTQEIRLGSFDTATQRQGHQGLADALGITNNGEWRGFVVTAGGKFVPTSHFNLVDGSIVMDATYEASVRDTLQKAGLVW